VRTDSLSIDEMQFLFVCCSRIYASFGFSLLVVCAWLQLTGIMILMASRCYVMIGLYLFCVQFLY